MTPLLYLAGPIDQAAGNMRLARWRELAKASARDAGVMTYDPARPFCVPAGCTPDDRIWKINWRALTVCDMMLAVMPVGAATIGTPMEIGEAVGRLGIPVAVCTDDGVSWALRRPGVQIFGLDEQGAAIDWLLERRQEMEGEERNTMAVQVLDAGGAMPQRTYDGDAGFDLCVSETTVVMPRQFIDIPCGVAVQLPPGTWGYLVGRSSTLRQRELLVNPGIIDNGYRGPLYVGVWNLGTEPNKVEAGDRIAQLIPMPLVANKVAVAQVDTLGDSDRAARGFGSTGR